MKIPRSGAYPPLLATCLVLALSVPAVAQRPTRVDTSALQRVLVAEDARGTGSAGVAPLVEALTSPDTLLRRVAVRAIGRLQRPTLARQLTAALTDAVPAIRAEAGNAIAQSVNRVRRRTADSGQADVKWAADELVGAFAAERDPSVADALAESLGRLPYGDSALAQAAESAILARGATGFGTVHGLYWLAVFRPVTGGLSPSAIQLLRSVVRQPTLVTTRRVAVLALGSVRGLDSATMAIAVHDGDDQIRRLALAGVAGLSPALRGTVVTAAFADPSPIVRIAAILATRAGVRKPDCGPIIAATNDPHPYVAQIAIDNLGSPCADSAAASLALLKILDQVPGAARSGPLQAHALVALAKVDRAKAMAPLAPFIRSTRAEYRAAAAEAATTMGDSTTLLRLSRDADHNVREAAITGLATVLKHGADDAYIAALASSGYQVSLAAANALAGSQHAGALPALLDNFDRVSRERRENARDPRMAILKRIAELGSSANSARLTPYLADFDTLVADSAARLLSRWSGTAVSAHPVALPIKAEPLAAIFLDRNIQLRVTMAGGGVFVVRLLSEEAPATVARIIELARAHYYDGHVFQRVEPNFVVQGGGPDASEYVGDAAFMRDELAWRSHFRGTVGISSRGRDTGDAQWFFNLTDNTRLDHEYTVFGEVVQGEDVVERIVAGDMIRSVVVTGR